MMSSWCTYYYTLPVVKSLQHFKEMSQKGYTTYFRKNNFFDFPPKNLPSVRDNLTDLTLMKFICPD